jgi:hypothetical protein
VTFSWEGEQELEIIMMLSLKVGLPVGGDANKSLRNLCGQFDLLVGGDANKSVR